MFKESYQLKLKPEEVNILINSLLELRNLYRDKNRPFEDLDSIILKAAKAQKRGLMIREESNAYER
ncbi:hypothetical protein [Ohessyouella blattaphilus]|uniref:Uncharacterized protein n=1 Tax=Ohessyouella blattaphilus TaxID=2949333 RepID=A0ABT1EJM2_9FIRM|nr:hypothetical protein [Ohessyouella blattaphilus]MCP1110905.1 hypothetical protein [Ohessyouella blattaphilus]MCR8564299.1 hypothetical protein [Ohessyouella blattaphilus]